MKNFISGCNILSKYDRDIELSAEHDIIYTSCCEDALSLADKAYIYSLGGWHWNDDVGCWAFFT